MILYIDGDAFPNLLKPIVLKGINRFKLKTIVISNKAINIGKSEYISYEIVNQGPDEADKKIVELTEDGDIVITADIPLADKVVAKGALGIDHRGELFTKENIKQLLAMRDLMASVREMGEMTKGPKAFGEKNVREFASSLNTLLQRKCRD